MGEGGGVGQARAITAAVFCVRGSDVFSRYFDDGPLPPLFHHHQHQQQQQQHLLFLADEAFSPTHPLLYPNQRQQGDTGPVKIHRP